jgi:hypothetical protein
MIHVKKIGPWSQIGKLLAVASRRAQQELSLGAAAGDQVELTGKDCGPYFSVTP